MPLAVGLSAADTTRPLIGPTAKVSPRTHRTGGGCLVVLSGGEVVGAHGSLQNMACSGMFGAWHEKRTHNSVEGEPITVTFTVGRDLGKRRCAQRFLVVPW